MGKTITINEAEVTLVQKWAVDPNRWVRDIFPDITLTAQQRQGFDELGKLIKAKMRARAGQKIDIRDSIYGYDKKIGISIMSGQGTGKDFFASMMILFFLTCFPDVKIPCTAPSAHQLKDVLWSEVSKLMRLAKKDKGKTTSVLEELLQWQSEKVFLKEAGGKEWFAVARTVNAKSSPDEQAETLSGFHEDYMLFVVDEASGVPDPVYRPIEGTLTGALNIVLLIFNPTKSKGYAVESHRKDAERWVCLRWNAEESEIVSREHIANMEKKYGRDSNPFRIRVLGLPPVAEKDALIPWDWIEDALDRDITPMENEPVIKGLDCGAGGDKSVIASRKGGKVTSFIFNNSKEAMDVAGWALHDFDHTGGNFLFYDAIGIGHGIGARVREQRGYKVFPVDSRSKPANARFTNKRAECYWRLREAFENKSISLPEGYTEIVDQLAVMKYDYDNAGKIKIIRKDKIKEEIGHSPDEADALALTYANIHITGKIEKGLSNSKPFSVKGVV